jgi:hypothetical protein
LKRKDQDWTFFLQTLFRKRELGGVVPPRSPLPPRPSALLLQSWWSVEAVVVAEAGGEDVVAATG